MLRLSGRLWKTRDHVIVGEGNPVAMHEGKAKSFPSMTYIGRWDSGMIRGVAIEKLEFTIEHINTKLYTLQQFAETKAVFYWALGSTTDSVKVSQYNTFPTFFGWNG